MIHKEQVWVVCNALLLIFHSAASSCFNQGIGVRSQFEFETLPLFVIYETLQAYVFNC